MLTGEALQTLLTKLPRMRIAVVGDLFLDRYWDIDPALDEPSLETGKAAWQVVGTRLSAGAAGTVLNNLSDLGIGSLHCVSLLGHDGEGETLKGLLHAKGVDTTHIVQTQDLCTPFYTKPMFQGEQGAAEGHRIDRLNRGSTPMHVQQRLLAALHTLSQQVDAVIFLDQLTLEGRGVVTPLIREAAAALRRDRPDLVLFADSRAFINHFRGISIKCNHLEAASIAGGEQAQAFDREGMFRSLRTLQADRESPVFITCSEHGIAVMQGDTPRLLPALRQCGPIDVVGAGDATTAGIVSALCAGASPVQAAAFGMLCAGITVRKLGTTGTATPEEIRLAHQESRET